MASNDFLETRGPVVETNALHQLLELMLLRDTVHTYGVTAQNFIGWMHQCVRELTVGCEQQTARSLRYRGGQPKSIVSP